MPRAPKSTTSDKKKVAKKKVTSTKKKVTSAKKKVTSTKKKVARKKVTVKCLLNTSTPSRCFDDYVKYNSEKVWKRRMRYFKKHHDIPAEEWVKKLNNQILCVICDEPDPRNIDHEHDTSQKGLYESKNFAGRIRAMLCNRCNIIEGKIKHLSPRKRAKHWVVKMGVVGNKLKERQLLARLTEHGYMEDHFEH